MTLTHADSDTNPVYYNENDPYAAQWLRNLIDAHLLPWGYVDDRSICDVTLQDIRGFDQCHFFAGIGGWPLALQLAGWPKDRPVWTGSCPCQPFSAAGKRKGTADARHLWPELHRLIALANPNVIFGEQVESKDGREWLAGVQIDVEALGFALGATDKCAASVAAPHRRQRLYWVADARHNDWTARSTWSKFESKTSEREWIGGDSTSRGLAESQRHTGNARRIANEPGEGIRTTRAGASVESGRRGVPGGLVQPIDSRLEGHAGNGYNGGEPGWLGAVEGGSITAAGTVGRDAGRMEQPALEQVGIPGCPRESRSTGTSRVAIADGWQQGNGDIQRSREHGQQPQNGIAGTVELAAINGRLERWPESIGPSAESRRLAGPGFWSASSIVHCLDGKARRIEPAPQQMADGFSEMLGRLRPDAIEEIEKEIANASITEECAREALRDLWVDLATQSVQQSTGRLYSVHEAPVLLTVMRELAGKGWGIINHLPSACWQTTKDGLREMQLPTSTITRSPSGREPGEQRSKQSANALSVLSQALARTAQEGGMIPHPLAHGVPTRVGKLRAYGNAIVPQVAAEFVRAYMEGAQTQWQKKHLTARV